MILGPDGGITGILSERDVVRQIGLELRKLKEPLGALVTLGTPHAFAPRIPWRHAGVRAAEHLARALALRAWGP